MKTCKGCGEHLPATSFYTAPSRYDGLSGHCRSCTKRMAADWNKNNREVVNKTKSAWREKNRDRLRENNKKYYKKWSDANAHKINAKQSRRRRSRSKATPDWLTADQKKEMLDMFLKASQVFDDAGEKYHVDHIHPLLGYNFCGLNVPWNLQLLSASENRAKKNSPPKDEAELFFEAPKWTTTLSQYRAGLTSKALTSRPSKSLGTAPSLSSLGVGRVSRPRSFVLKWLGAKRKSALTLLTTGVVQMKMLIEKTRSLREFLIFLRAISLKVV